MVVLDLNKKLSAFDPKAIFKKTDANLVLKIIIFTALEVTGVTYVELFSLDRSQRIAKTRHIITYFAYDLFRTHTNLLFSYPKIGKELGRDHTTIVSSRHRIQALLDRDKIIQKQIKDIALKLNKRLTGLLIQDEVIKPESIRDEAVLGI